MPKDFNTLSAEIGDPQIKKTLAKEADLRRAELAIDALDSELAEAMQARKVLPEVLAQMRTLEAVLARPLSVAATVAPAKAKATQNRATPQRLVATAIGAMFARRTRQIEPQTFIRSVFDGDSNRQTRMNANAIYKSGTEPGSTTDAGFASALTDTVLNDYIQSLAPTSVVAQLRQSGYARRLDFRGGNATTFPSRNVGTLPADWIAENEPINVKSGMFNAAIANRYKLAVIAAVSNEIRRVSNVEIVDLVENAIMEDTAVALDGFFMDAEFGVVAKRPAGIMNGANTQAATGTGTVEDVQTDLKWLLAQMITIRARTPVLLMNPLLVSALSMKLAGSTGIAPFAAELQRGTLAGIPFITSANCDPTTVIALDADNLLIAIDAPEFDASEHAAIIMGDDLENDVNVEVRSMFQTWETAIRFVQPTSWAFTRAGVVHALTAVNW